MTEKIKKYRARTHMVLLYPENAEHLEAFKKIQSSFEYAAITHDKDQWTLDDEKINPEHKAGTFKKAHIHIIIRFNQARWNTSIADELGIAPNYLEQVKSLDNSLQYLIHYNESDKHQYSVDEVSGSMVKRLKESINKNEKTEGEKVNELIEYIENQNQIITITDFSKYCACNGYWAEFRRSGAIFCKIIEEHNKSLLRSLDNNVDLSQKEIDYYTDIIKKALKRG